MSVLRDLSDDEDFVYSRPMLAAVKAKRLFRLLTQKYRYVNVRVETGEMPPPENQHINGHKWRYFINVVFDGSVPQLGWDQMNAFNELLLMTETDRMLVGVTFVTVFTDTPWDYDRVKLAKAVCLAFGLELNELTVDELSHS